MTDLKEVLQKIADGRTDKQEYNEPNIFLNWQQIGCLKEILLAELSVPDASAGYKAIVLGIINQLNEEN